MYIVYDKLYLSVSLKSKDIKTYVFVMTILFY